MTNENTGTTLREQLSQTFDSVVSQEPAPKAEATVETAPEVKADVKQEAKTETKTEGRTAGRERDANGRLLPGKAEKPEPAAQQTAAPAKPKPAYPSTWKKDYQAKWETIDPDLAEEIHRRESDYAKGVSTYKGEYDRLKSIDEVLKPYQPFLQQANMKPEQFVDALAKTDQTLRYGSPDDKLRAFAKFAQDYQIPVHQLLVQGDDGKVYLNQNYFQQQQAAQNQGIAPQDVQKLVAQQVMELERQRQIREFLEAKDDSGNPKYPHFEAVKATMDGLLRARLAQDLPSAYVRALRMPEHAELVQAEENSKREAEKAAEVKAKQEQAARAKAAAVSTKSQSPTGTVTTATQGRKGLRASLEAAFEQHTDGGRV